MPLTHLIMTWAKTVCDDLWVFYVSITDIVCATCLSQGRLAVKWITDFVDGDLGADSLRCTHPGTSHNLYTVTSQSAPKEGLVVCICGNCKKTFTLQVECTGGRCKDVERTHHLVLLDEDKAPANNNNKYYPIISKLIFQCSALVCSLKITLDVCKPRLDPQYEPDMVDRVAPRKRLDELLASDDNGGRYEDLMKPDKILKLFPAYYMLQYLNDVINPGSRDLPLKVSVRNKFYTVCFWNRFQDLLDFMEFQALGEGDEKFIQLPFLDGESDGIPPYTTRRAWFEILMIHFHFLQGDLPDSLKHPIDFHIQLGTRDILIQLLDAKYAKTRFANIEDYDPADFRLLGVTKDVHEAQLWYACFCQGQTNPSQRREFYEALCRVSRGRETQNTELRQYLEDEAVSLTTLMSMHDTQPSPLSRAYQAFGLPESCGDRVLIYKFSERVTKTQSTQDLKSDRLNLSIIGKARKSHAIMEIACAFDGPDDAAAFLGVGTQTEPDWIVTQSVVEENEGSFDKVLVASAVRALASFHNNNPQLLQHAFDLEARSGESWLNEGDSITVAPAFGAPATRNVTGTTVDASLPVGLVNIRNTCYLNSLLQYFNTVVPVRDVVLNWEEYKLEPTEDNIKGRRLGGSGSALDKAEAFLASKFVEEMRALFLELQSSNENAIRPQQRLALAALKTADQIIKGKPTEVTAAVFGPQPNPNANRELPPPPPLPARPSPKPPTGPTVTVNPIPDTGDTGSNVSSATLVDQKDEEHDQTYVTVSASQQDKPIPQVVPAKERSALDDDDNKGKGADSESIIRGRSATREKQDNQGNSDVKMGGTEETEVENSLTVEEKITEALNDTSVTGTDQQDVEEVMGNILEHLHAAIKPTGVDEKTGRQTDIITETFYWSSVNQIRTVDMKTGKANSPYRSVPDLSRWMTAFPAENGGIDLYAALDKNFDQEFQEDGNETFTSITKASPILHVYIQRSQNVAGRLARNSNVVEIPEVLYLDRYMDGAIDSDVFKRRQRSWNLKRRIKSLDGRSSADTPPPTSDKGKKKEEVKEAGYEVVESIEEYEKELMSVDNTGEGEGEEEYVSILDPETQKMLAEHNLLPTVAKRGDTILNGTPRETLLANLDPDAARRVQQKVDEDKKSAREELSSLFDDMKDVAYRLHAVICHGGGYGSGHYWVWIYDFEKELWRKYNDEMVEVHTDKAKVLADLNGSGNPYYVAYIRDEEVSRLVSVPQRLAAAKGAPNMVTSPTERSGSNATSSTLPSGAVDPLKLQAPGAAEEVINGIDVDMEDAHVMHVENRNE